MRVSARGVGPGLARGSGLALALAVVGELAGCGVGCDPADHARRAAGAGAVDCGFAPVSADRTALLACLDEAQAAGVPFVGGWASVGRDSVVTLYVAQPSEGDARVYSHDSFGGRLTVAGCTSPFRRALDLHGDESLVCDGDPARTATICD